MLLGTDACVVPVLTPEEAASLDASKSPLPRPHPHLSRTPSAEPGPHAFFAQTLQMVPGQHNEEVLRELGTSAEEWKRLVDEGAISKESTAKL